MMTLQYIITGGQLYLEKTAFTRELLLADSPIKILLYGKENTEHTKPKIEKSEDRVKIDFNQAEVQLDDGFYDLFRKLKEKYRNHIKGRVVIRITALTSYYVTLNLDSEEDKVIYD